MPGKKMAINPLQSNVSTGAFPEPVAAKRNSTPGSSFHALLGNLRGGSVSAQAPQAAATLFQMEMMQKTLSLSGEGESSLPSGIKALESLLSGLTPTRQVPFSGKDLTRQVTQQGEAVPSERSQAAPAAVDTKVEEIGKTAAQFIGTPYRFGGEGAAGIDCSSFVQQVFGENQINLPRTAREQSKLGEAVAAGDLKKGDLLFFHTYASYPSHVGIYLGDGKMIHASSGKGEVTVSNLDSDYYRSHFMGARRVT